jgi:hypothetical protein
MPAKSFVQKSLRQTHPLGMEPFKFRPEAMMSVQDAFRSAPIYQSTISTMLDVPEMSVPGVGF